MSVYRVGYVVGSLSSTSINRRLAEALVRLAPPELEFFDIPIRELPLYSQDYDADYPAEGRALKQAIESADAILIVTPEYNRSIPGALKNALDWSSRPPGTGSLRGTPVAVIGASTGAISTAVAQQHLRGVLAFLDAPQMAQPEGYIRFTPDMVLPGGEVPDAGTADFLRGWVTAFRDFVVSRVLR